MYTNGAYLNNFYEEFTDLSRPLVVGSCGHYRLYDTEKTFSFRPYGRVDYQILYIAFGKAHFIFDGVDTIVSAGNMVLYRPHDVQHYIYYGQEQIEVYWVHFTGSDVENILNRYGFSADKKIFSCGIYSDYSKLFLQILNELQTCNTNFEELISILLNQLIILTYRNSLCSTRINNSFTENEMETAAQYFTQNYNKDINIDEYAISCGMSISWFIRSFKKHTGTTPMQYIVSLRITNACALLVNSDYSIQEISDIVGYNSPLYFSRIFKKSMGCPPSTYRIGATANKHI